MLHIFFSLGLGFLTFVGAAQAKEVQGKSSVYDFALSTLGGKPLDLSEFKGQVLVLVNTASNCGFTKQFAGLEKLYKEEKSKGLTVIGIPSNSFKQELADEKAVGEFCKMNYGVTFPMSKIVEVKGEKTHPLYQFLVAEAPKSEAGEVRWNFEKFLIDRKGQVVDRYRSSTAPDDARFKASLARVLAEKT